MQGPRDIIAPLVVILACFSLAVPLGIQAKPKPPKGPTYSSVLPIFKKCTGCHSGPSPKHGLDLTSYANIMKGDTEGKVVIAKNPGKSRLSQAIHHSPGAKAMPPGSSLPAASIGQIDAWIKAGAKEK